MYFFLTSFSVYLFIYSFILNSIRREKKGFGRDKQSHGYHFFVWICCSISGFIMSVFIHTSVTKSSVRQEGFTNRKLRISDHMLLLFVCLFFAAAVGPVTEVKTDIYVTSFGPVSDVEMVHAHARAFTHTSFSFVLQVFCFDFWHLYTNYVYVTIHCKKKFFSHMHPPTPFHPVSGVHDGRVLSTDVGGPQVDVRGTHWNITAQQPDGDQGLDARHLLPKRQEVGRSQHDGAKQAFPHHEERHHSVHHEVELHTQKEKQFNPAAWAGPKSQTSAPNTGTSTVGHGCTLDIKCPFYFLISRK